MQNEGNSKIYIDSRYKPSDYVSNSNLTSEIREGIGLLDNTICYIDDFSTPHIWYTIEYYNNITYIETINQDYTLITLPIGNYTAAILITTIESLLQTRFPEHGFYCKFNNNVGRFKITNSSNSNLRIMTDEMAIPKQGSDSTWYGNLGDVISQPDYTNLRSINEVLRKSINVLASTSYESCFLDILNVRYNIYTYIYIYIYQFSKFGTLRQFRGTRRKHDY